jgi:hypothetical protein
MLGEKGSNFFSMSLYCCEGMHYALLETVKVIEYNQKIREYAFKIPNSSTYMLLDYCCFCGVKLPSSLRREWCALLRSEYKIQSFLGEDSHKIPIEFLTDEWWKERHLGDFDKLLQLRKQLQGKIEDKRSQKIDQSIEKDRLNYRGPYCCVDVDWEIDDSMSVMKYCPQYREYQIQSVGQLVLDYCPFCGKKEPQSLRKKWFEILKSEYGLEDPLKTDKKKIPAEFLTDEWWKKRGL